MRVEVAAPRVCGDTVQFRWTQSEPNPFQHDDGFFFRYEGLDLARCSPGLCYELFLGLQLRVFAAYGKAVEVVFPEPVSRPTVEFWTAYHDADLVSIAPVAEVASYAPWTSSPPSPQDRRRAGVFFGGGKDSMLAACLLSEIYGADSIVLLQFVHPFLRGAAAMNRLTRRQDELMLRPARERLGVATQRAWTDYLAQLRSGGAGRRVRPHLELYSVGLLPALLAWDVRVCTPGLERTNYRGIQQAGGSLWFRYGHSRPEMLATQSRHYQRVLGADLTVTNLNLLFTCLMAVRLLAERYPRAFAQIVMCMDAPAGQRWCHDCKKCVEYAIYSLGSGIVDPHFDYDALFARSRSIGKLMRYAESGVERSVFGNAPSHPALPYPGQYLVICHAIAQIEPGLIAGRLGRTAYANLLVLKALFGNRLFPSAELLSTKCLDLLGTDVARAAARIAAEHFAMVEDLPRPWLAGNDEVSYDFGLRMPTRTGLLDHIKV